MKTHHTFYFHGGTNHEKVIFDIDGVLLSEERYFDVSALTVWEILYSPAYMGLPGERDDFNAGRITEGQIAGCRSVVWEMTPCYPG